MIKRQLRRIRPRASQLPHRFDWSTTITVGEGMPSLSANVRARSGKWRFACPRYQWRRPLLTAVRRTESAASIGSLHVSLGTGGEDFQRAPGSQGISDDAIAPESRTGAAVDGAKVLEGYAGVVDWQHKEDVQRQMRRAIKQRLRALGMNGANIEAATAKVMDVARARLGT
jgi:hypothetical protein